MKQFETKEECLKEMGEHAWFKVEKDTSMGIITCAAYHPDGYCSWNDLQERCYHCPAKRTYTRKQPEIFEWVEK